MSRTITDVANTDFFQVWFDRTNNLLQAMSSEIVTANAGGATTTGNGMVIGFFGANTIFGTNLRGGNTSVAANLNVTSNVNFEQGKRVNNTTYLNVNVTTTGTGSQVIDSFKLASYRSAEYCFTMKNTVANGYQVSKLLVLQDEGTAYVTEYGIVASNGIIGAFSVSANATDVIVNCTPAAGVTGSTIQGTKIVTSI